ncbi:Protein of unknown function [Gryllus bimaculatus]|nr:Protein of unknown function [Gryllus bimaculatus]
MTVIITGPPGDVLALKNPLLVNAKAGLLSERRPRTPPCPHASQPFPRPRSNGRFAPPPTPPERSVPTARPHPLISRAPVLRARPSGARPPAPSSPAPVLAAR